MGKIVTCPVKRYEGSVTIKDPIPYLDILKLERAGREFSWETSDIGDAFIPPILACIEKWELKNFPENPTLETFPGTPRSKVNRLLAWLLNSVRVVYVGNEDNDPNA